MIIYFYREVKGGRKRERNINARGKHRLVASCIYPDRGTEPTT